MAIPTTTIRLPTNLRRQLERFARTRDATRTEVMIRALQEFLDRNNSAERRQEVTHEIERLAEIDRADPEFSSFYGEPEEDPFRDEQ